MGRFSANFRQNFRDGFTKTALVDDLVALVAPPALYYGIPAVTEQQGYSAMITAVGSMFLLGKAFNIPSLVHGALAIGGFHLLYDNQEKIVKYTNKPMWALNPEKVEAMNRLLQKSANDAAAALEQAQSQLPPGAVNGLGNAVVDSFNGQPVLTYPGANELPQLNGFQRVPVGTTAASDYSNDSLLNGESIYN